MVQVLLHKSWMVNMHAGVYAIIFFILYRSVTFNNSWLVQWLRCSLVTRETRVRFPDREQSFLPVVIRP